MRTSSVLCNGMLVIMCATVGCSATDEKSPVREDLLFDEIDEPKLSETRIRFPHYKKWPRRDAATMSKDVGGVDANKDGGAATSDGASDGAAPPLPGKDASPEASPPVVDAAPVFVLDASSEPPPALPGAPGAGASGFTQQGTIVVPVAHPRIFWNAERIAQGKLWFSAAANRATLEDAIADSYAAPLDLAAHYILTGTQSSCRRAIARTLAYTIDANTLDNSPCDTCRWEPWPYVVYDWCHGELTQGERATLLPRFTDYVERVIKNSQRDQASGNLAAPANNYFWGYLRNEMTWGIASMHESASAQKLLDYGVTTRWQNSVVPFYTQAGGRGGAALEGSHYGPYMQEYSVLPFSTAKLLGRNLYRETPYYREAILYWIHATLPKETATRTGARTYHQIFPFGDDGEADGYPALSANTDVGTFVTTLADEFRDVPVGAYARRFLSTFKPPVLPWVAAVDHGGVERPIEELPLDYVAIGPGMFFTRDHWGRDSTVAKFSLGRTESFGGHDNADYGSFQIWRNGYWLTKETSLYAQSLDWGSAQSTLAKNGITLRSPKAWGGRPYGASEGNPLGRPVVVRAESADDYSFAATDLSLAYDSSDWNYYVEENGVRAFRDHNPYAVSAVREFVFLRALGMVVVLDRIATRGSTSDAPTAQVFPEYVWKANEVERVFNLQMPTPTPSIDRANRSVEVASGGGQVLRLTTALPTTGVEYVVVDEMAKIASNITSENRQWRLEARVTSSAESHSLHVLEATSTTDERATVQATEDASSITLIVSHPTKGQARVTFQKGMKSVGGAITVGSHAPRTLRTDVQGHLVGDNGPKWGP